MPRAGTGQLPFGALSTPESPSLRERSGRYSAAQLRTIAVALDLFAENGFGGTSLQMIADALGVTKAAVYHQFRTKEAIAVGVIVVELAGLEEAIERAEADGDDAAREFLLERVVDAAVQRRRAVGALQHDPVLVRFLGEDEQARNLWRRLFSILVGAPFDAPGRTRAAVLSATIGAVDHPFVADLPDDVLRRQLLDAAGLLIGPTDASS